MNALFARHPPVREAAAAEEEKEEEKAGTDRVAAGNNPKYADYDTDYDSMEDFDDYDSDVSYVSVSTMSHLRFNGDRHAFVNADLNDFFALLQKGPLVWMNDYVCAYNWPLSQQEEDPRDDVRYSHFYITEDEPFIRQQFEQHIRIQFNTKRFALMCRREVQASDVPIFDMFWRVSSTKGQQACNWQVFWRMGRYA
jgi:hypothetical protein